MSEKSKIPFPETRHSLLARLKSTKSQQAWEEFITLYRPIIFRIARGHGLQEADAQDLTQTVLISISKSIESWEPRDDKVKFRHWVRKVVKNAILKALTRKPRDQAVGGSAVQGLLEIKPTAEEQIEKTLILEQQREIYFRAAACVKAEVTSNSWQIFQLAVVEGVPIEKVAEQLEKSIGAAYAARGRVMKRLKATVQRFEEELG